MINQNVWNETVAKNKLKSRAVQCSPSAIVGFDECVPQPHKLMVSGIFRLLGAEL